MKKHNASEEGERLYLVKCELKQKEGRKEVSYEMSVGKRLKEVGGASVRH